MGGQINKMQKAKEAYLWVSFAVFSLILAGIFALLIALTRTPYLNIHTSYDYFYSSLVGHVIFSIVIWLLTFQVGIWHLSFPELKKDKISFPLVILGSALIAFPAIFGLGEPYINNYVPVIGSPYFYAGLFIFGLGILINIIKYLPQAFRYLASDNNSEQLAAVSTLLAFIMMLSLFPSFMRASTDESMKIYFERAFWIPGHIQQFVNAAMMLIGWQFLIETEGSKTENSKWLKFSNIFLLVTALPLLYGLIVDPLSTSVKYIILFAFGGGIGIPVLIHTLYTIRKFPKNLKSIAAHCLIFSFLVYYTGAIIAYAGLQDDMRVPAHYHGVVTAVTLALMGMTYYILRTMNKRVFLEKLARIQPAAYGIGMLFLIAGLYWAGKLGAARKVYEFAYHGKGSLAIAMSIMGSGAVLAVIGGVLFVLYASVSILKGRHYEKVL